jgi:hypothetical protein
LNNDKKGCHIFDMMPFSIENSLIPRCVKCTKTEKSIGKGAHFDKLNNRSLVALFQALSETAGNLPRCIIKFHANGFERWEFSLNASPKNCFGE